MATTTKYLPTERLGSGPTCDVFLGRDVGGLNRRVAIKQLREDVRGHASRREAFFAAAEKWSQFEHESLVTLFDLDRAEGCVIYEPHPLSGKQMIAQGSRTPAQAAEVLSQTANALLYIHNLGLLHLNIKPSNVLFDNANRANLIDGRCYERDRIGELPLPTGGQKYLAPELIDPALGQIGPATDIYCLGFVILEILLGPDFDELFRGVGVDAIDADRNWLRWHASRDEPIPSLVERRPDLPPEFERVLHRMLNKDPLQRYHSAVELLDELRAVQVASSASQEKAPATDSRSAVPSPNVSERPIRPTTAPAAGAPEQPKLDDIPNRPAAPVVIRFLGCDSEMVGVNKDFFTLGDAADCDVPFPAALRRDGQTVFRLGRAAEGWRLNGPIGIQYYVNQEVVTSAANLRSGDIVRLSPGGPGLQFTILNQNAESLSKLAARYAPRLVQPGAEAAAVKSAPPALVTAGNNVQRAAPPSRTAAPAPVRSPAAPAKPAAAPTKPGAAPAPPNQTSAAPARPAAQKIPDSAAKGRVAAALDYKNWSKSTKNWVILVVSLLTMGIVIGLWPSAPETKDAATPPPAESASRPMDPAPEETPAQGDPATPETPATSPEAG